MTKNPKEGKLLYHLTSLDNIESILSNGLIPREKIDFKFQNIADKEILRDRKNFNLSEYTPFHFFCPTPFSGSVQKANLDTEFVYVTIKRDFAKKNNFKIVPRHPLNYDGKPLNWKEGIEEMDWDLVAVRDYSDYECKEACMAESLFKGTVLPENFNCIFVRTKEVKSKVSAILQRNKQSIEVTVNQWFFIKK